MVFFMKSTYFLCALVAVSQAAPGYQRPNPHALSEDLQDTPKGYRFAFSSKDTESNQQREETADDNGHVKGSYSFDLPDGTKRHVRYIADEGGFRVKIDSNEAGLEAKNPADVKFIPQANARLRQERTDGHSAAQKTQGWSNAQSAPLKTSGWSNQPSAPLKSSAWSDAPSAPLKTSGWSNAAPVALKSSGWSDEPSAPLKASKWADVPKASSGWSDTPSASQKQGNNKWADELPLPVRNNGWTDDQSAPLKNAGWSAPAPQKDGWTASQKQVWSDSDKSPASNEWSGPSAALKQQSWPEAPQKNAWTDDDASASKAPQKQQEWTPKSAPIRQGFSDGPARQRGWTPGRSAASRQSWSDEQAGAQKVQGWQSDNVSASPKDSWSQKTAAIHQGWAPQKSAVIGQGCADESANLKQSGWSESAAQEQKPWSGKSAPAEQGWTANVPKNQGWTNEAQDYASLDNGKSVRRGDPKFERLTAESAGQKSNVRLELPHADKVEWFAPPAPTSAALNQKW